MKTEHKLVIGHFYSHDDLYEMCTYGGNNGGVVLRLRTASNHLVIDIEAFCKEHDIECVPKYNHNLGGYEVFCIAEDDVYELAIPKKGK